MSEALRMRASIDLDTPLDIDVRAPYSFDNPNAGHTHIHHMGKARAMIAKCPGFFFFLK